MEDRAKDYLLNFILYEKMKSLDKHLNIVYEKNLFDSMVLLTEAKLKELEIPQLKDLNLEAYKEKYKKIKEYCEKEKGILDTLENAEKEVRDISCDFSQYESTYFSFFDVVHKIYREIYLLSPTYKGFVFEINQKNIPLNEKNALLDVLKPPQEYSSFLKRYSYYVDLENKYKNLFAEAHEEVNRKFLALKEFVEKKEIKDIFKEKIKNKYFFNLEDACERVHQYDWKDLESYGKFKELCENMRYVEDIDNARKIKKKMLLYLNKLVKAGISQNQAAEDDFFEEETSAKDKELVNPVFLVGFAVIFIVLWFYSRKGKPSNRKEEGEFDEGDDFKY
jgi:hypothetical protein